MNGAAVRYELAKPMLTEGPKRVTMVKLCVAFADNPKPFVTVAVNV